MHILHLTASTFFGGPERQMLGLALNLPAPHCISVASFAEGGRCETFLNEARHAGFAASSLTHDTPHLRAAVRELMTRLQRDEVDVLLCHGYKANLLGRVAARRVGIPAIAVSRGWTGETRKVKLYETADRAHLRLMDHVVAVSEGQAAKVRACGVRPKRLTVIRNAARLAAFTRPDPAYRGHLRAKFTPDVEVTNIILAAGRLSPEKGFDVLVHAAADVVKNHPTTGFVLFGEGTERTRLESMIQQYGLTSRFMLPGFTDGLDCYLPWADVVVLPSHTEGLPNIALEASAAGMPVVATAVGGTPEVIADGETGYLVPPGDVSTMSKRICKLVNDPIQRKCMGDAGRQRMQDHFTFAAQTRAYVDLLGRLCRQSQRVAA